MEQFRKPSTQLPRALGSGVRSAIVVAVSVPAAVFASSLLNRFLGSPAGDILIAAAAAVSVMFYWDLSRKQLDEIGQRLFMEAATFCLSCLVATAVALAVLWKKMPVLQEALSAYGFTLFFSTAAVTQAFGYWRARRKLR